jgi:hypothetical protein
MTTESNSSRHHWWPVGLQYYWSDKAKNVSWIEADGKISKKRYDKRNIAFKLRGHTSFPKDDWEHNFEGEFNIDSAVHSIIDWVNSLKPYGRTPTEFFGLLKLFFKKERTLSDVCKFYKLDETLHRDLLLFMFSLLIRSPANRWRYEQFPSRFGLPADENIGKLNMSQNYGIAQRLCDGGLISNQYFVFLHSSFKNFICGDGTLDWLTSNLSSNRISGQAIIPITPKLCIYFSTPMQMRSAKNCASLTVADWMVDRINEISQIYSKDKLFFLGGTPKLTEAFRKRQFLEHKNRTDDLLEMLDEIAGIKKSTLYFPFLNGLS